MNKRKIIILFAVLISVLQVFSEDYYWVGGQGDWSDLNSWRSNGNIPNEVPDAEDNVIFNEYSFTFQQGNDTVFILTGNPVCKNLTFYNSESYQDTVVIVGGNDNSTFSIYGSVSFGPSNLITNPSPNNMVVNDYMGKIFFMSDLAGNTITCSGTRFPGDINFEGPGEWILQDTLFVLDIIPAYWDSVIYYFLEPDAPNPKIFHNNGIFNANEQTIINRGFSTTGNKPRSCFVQNCDILMVGDWQLVAENLNFNADNSYIFIGGSMTNSFGELISYHDIDVMKQYGSFNNNDIRTYMRKVHFLGSGKLDGKPDLGQEGSFTIDTLLFDGGFSPAGPIPCEIKGVLHNIHYTLIELVPGFIETKKSEYHRIDYKGDSPSYFKGYENEIDSIHFFISEGILAGDNIVNDLLLFNTMGVLSSWFGVESNINHAIFGADGFIMGSNTINLLSLSSGFWYQLQADSLTNPGGGYTNSHIQTINDIEVLGGCEGGLSIISSDFNTVRALIDTQNGFTTEYLMIKDLKNLNANTDIIVNSGVDLGNNEGFTITENIERDLFWVGGAGDWNDKTHWSSNSGVVPGDQCPPTIRDNVTFDVNSGFVENGMIVNVNNKYATFNDMLWTDDVQNLPILSGSDTNNLKIAGSVKLSQSMIYNFNGKVYFESTNDTLEWETIDWENYVPDDAEPTNPTWAQYIGHYIPNKTYFNGEKGRWQLESNLYVFDTLFLISGDLKIETHNDDYRKLLSVKNFYAGDTLSKGLYLPGKSKDGLGTLIEVHAFKQDGFVLGAWRNDTTFYVNQQNEVDTILPKTYFDAGFSTIRSVGDWWLQSPEDKPGTCNIKTMYGQDTVRYYNIEFITQDLFSDTLYAPDVVYSEKSRLLTDCLSQYNLVDYYCAYGDAYGNGVIDTLTYKKIINEGNGETISADGCKLRNEYYVNFLIAESFGDTIMQSQTIDTAFFYDQGMIRDYNTIGYLEADKFMHIVMGNTIDTAWFKGNAMFTGDGNLPGVEIHVQNTFHKLTLSPDKRYIFQHENSSDTTVILDDLVIEGFCDQPIRLQSDSIGTQALVLYKMQQPSNASFTAKYTSLRDINIVEFEDKDYIAQSSIDLGNNTNWTWTLVPDEEYYWVGGTGNWSDGNHWSYESGGPPYTDCTPKEINTVIFDDNSFLTPTDTVTVDPLTGYCKNMYWKHSDAFTPTFLGADTTVLYVYGSLELNDSLNYQYSGEIYFDQIDEVEFDGDTITSKNKKLLNNIRFQGIDDIVVLGDDLTIDTIRTVWLEHGELKLFGNHLTTGKFFSTYKNIRILDIENSKATIWKASDTTWRLNGINLTLKANSSTIYNQGQSSKMLTEFGSNLHYNNIELNGQTGSLVNHHNICEYNLVSINMPSGLVTGNFIADTIFMRSMGSTIDNISITNVIYLDGYGCTIKNKHTINRCYVNSKGYIIGNNMIKYCVFYDDGYFIGDNIFDTLVLYPGAGNEQGLGNWFYFGIGSTQTINDSLYIRGNQCSNINLSNYPDVSPLFGTILVNTDYDIVCDYLNIKNVIAESETIEFYAGINSTPLPNPENPPPGWTFENAQGYIYGFDGRTDRFCLDTEYIIDASNFNGDENTLYFWEGSPYPGDVTYTVSEPGTYHIKVQYFDGCTVDDYIVVEGNYPPKASIDPGPYCEGDMIEVRVSPDNNAYHYSWFNGETTSGIVADLNFPGDIYVQVIDTTNKCESIANQAIVVKPTPDPESALGDDVWIKFQETIVLDAGEGDLFTWTSTPTVEIENPNAQTITVNGYNNPVEYKVNVEIDGCPAEGLKIVNMYPPSKWGVPTAFSPNDQEPNDVLYVFGSGFAELVFRVYDRYGKLMFETTNPDRSEGWDGTFNGAPQEMDVYTYYLKIIFQDGGVVEDKGNITLLR